jgi:hypothetical protein
MTPEAGTLLVAKEILKYPRGLSQSRGSGNLRFKVRLTLLDEALTDVEVIQLAVTLNFTILPVLLNTLSKIKGLPMIPDT